MTRIFRSEMGRMRKVEGWTKEGKKEEGEDEMGRGGRKEGKWSIYT